MIKLSSTRIINFVGNDFRARTIEEQVDAALIQWNIRITPTRLKNIKIRLKFRGHPPHDLNGTIRVFYFKDTPGAHQSELIYLENFVGRREIDYISDEEQFWNDFPFIVTSIGFCPESLTTAIPLEIDILKI